MHDLDRTTREFESALHEMEMEHPEFESLGESHEWEYEGLGHEALHEAHELHEMHEAHEFHEVPEFEMHETHELYETHETHEAEEMELAAELLEVTNEYELEQFLENFIKRPKFRIPRPTLKALAKNLKPIAMTALKSTPVGQKVMLAQKLASLHPATRRYAAAANMLLEAELEGLSHEDREFEAARRTVRLGQKAVANAARANPAANPQAVAKAAIATAARQIASSIKATSPAAAVGRPVAGAPTYPPVALPPTAASTIPSGSRFRGTWIRRGRRIILYGV